MGSGGGDGGSPVIPSRASSKAAQSVRSIVIAAVLVKHIDPLLLNVPETAAHLCERAHNPAWERI